MDIEVRPATPKDCAAMTAVMFRAKRSNGYDDAFMEACRSDLMVSAESLTRAAYWVAENSHGPGDVLGCAALAAGHDEETGEVRAFFVEPAHQGCGVGRALWHRIRAEAGCRAWRHLVLDADPAATAFYERLGFSVIGESPSGSIPGRFLPRMAIDLPLPLPA